MKDCTVSIIGQDGQTYSRDVTAASSLFDAVDQAVQGWAKLWWWHADAVVEVRARDERWKIRAGRVREWKASRRAR
jgi:hypothetical protein